VGCKFDRARDDRDAPAASGITQRQGE